jgi:hypothetical protein
MVTNINLPIVLSFTDKDHVDDFIEAAQEIIPKVKYTNIGGEGYNCIVYTRKDKHYRLLMEAASAPTVIVETPVFGPPNTANANGDVFVVDVTYDMDGAVRGIK